jgi:hypothetical protein
MRGLIAVSLLCAAFVFSHIVIVSSVLALLAGGAVISVVHYYQQH